MHFFYWKLAVFSQIFIEVVSVDSWWGRVRAEGYGFASVPYDAGCHEVEIKTWRPLKGNASEMRYLNKKFKFGKVFFKENIACLNPWKRNYSAKILSSFCRRYFVGGTPELDDLSYAGTPVQKQFGTSQKL